MSWKEDKQLITERHFEAINISNIELFGIIKDHYEEVRQIFPLIKFILDRLETVTTLATGGRLWDAEIVLRSTLETFVKYMFIITATGDERLQRIDEYWNLLSEVSSIKQSNQAKKNLEFLGESEIHKLAYSPLVLPDEVEKRLREKWPKKERQRLEQKWSFSEIVLSLSRDNKGNPLEMLGALAHSYRMSSHVMHGDETGVLIIEERASRSQQEQDKVNAAHYLRLMSDSLSYSAWTAVETMHFLGLKEEKKFFFENQKSLDDIQPLIEKYHAAVFEDSYYDKYK